MYTAIFLFLYELKVKIYEEMYKTIKRDAPHFSIKFCEIYLPIYGKIFSHRRSIGRFRSLLTAKTMSSRLSQTPVLRIHRQDIRIGNGDGRPAHSSRTMYQFLFSSVFQPLPCRHPTPRHDLILSPRPLTRSAFVTEPFLLGSVYTGLVGLGATNGR